MTAKEQVQSVIDELKAGRKGAWIFDENSNVKADIYTFDAIKILEALKDSGDVIEHKLPKSVEDIKKQAEEMRDILKNIKTVGDIIDFESEIYELNLDDLEVVTDKGEVISSEELFDDEGMTSIEDLPREWKVSGVCIDEYGDDVNIANACYSHADERFEFDLYDKYGLIVEGVEIDTLESVLKEEDIIYDPEDFRGNAVRMDNTYNYNCNISNDMDWCEGIDNHGDRFAMLKFHIAGDVRGNYTDEIFVNIDGYGGLLEYLYDRLNLPECRSLGDCTIDIDPFSEGVNILTEDGREFKCYDIEEKDIVAKIEEETGVEMKAFKKSDVKDDKPKANIITKE